MVAVTRLSLALGLFVDGAKGANALPVNRGLPRGKYPLTGTCQWKTRSWIRVWQTRGVGARQAEAGRLPAVPPLRTVPNVPSLKLLPLEREWHHLHAFNSTPHAEPWACHPCRGRATRACHPCGCCNPCNPVMSKRKKKQQRPPATATFPLRRPAPLAGEESRQSLAVTVAWMLALLVTLAAEAIAIPAAILARANPPPPGPGLSAVHVANLFLFVALVTGLVAAGLVPLVYRVRTVPPPQSIAIVALVAGAVPPITMVIRWLF